MRVTVWGENVHEQRDESVRTHYPEGMHTTIAGALRDLLGGTAEIRTATLQEPEHGLTETTLAGTDVLTWWGHTAHDMVDDAQRKVSRGLDQADESLDDLRDTAIETTKENPLKVILMVAAIAAAVGFVVGMASSRRS